MTHIMFLSLCTKSSHVSLCCVVTRSARQAKRLAKERDADVHVTREDEEESSSSSELLENKRTAAGGFAFLADSESESEKSDSAEEEDRDDDQEEEEFGEVEEKTEMSVVMVDPAPCKGKKKNK